MTNLTPGKRMAYGYWPTVYWCSDENDDTVVPTLNWISAKNTKVLMEGQSMKYMFNMFGAPVNTYHDLDIPQQEMVVKDMPEQSGMYQC